MTHGWTREALILEHIAFRYPEYPGVPSGKVLEDVNASFARGEVSMVLGKPEAGKTTLSRIMAGLVPRHTGGTLEGRIAVPGLPEELPAPPEMIEHLGIVFQDADEQILMTRCDYEAAFALESLGVSRADMKRRLSEAFEVTGLQGFESRNPAQLSGGEKKKLLMASLIAVNPAFWILDETLEELDLPTRKKILSFLRVHEAGVILFSSRYPGLLGSYFDSFSLLSSGKVAGPFTSPDEEDLAGTGGEGLFLKAPESGPGPSGRYPAGDSVLRVDDLSFSYSGKGAFSLDVEHLAFSAGETVCLVGRNGCGKSTLGKILCGLLRPEKGRISLAEPGALPVKAEPEELHRHVGYMFQNPDYQIFLPSVREELMYGSRFGEDTIREAAELFSLGSLDAPPALLSYGTRKRLQAACYFLLSRCVYILDEADSGISYGDFRCIIRNLAGPGRCVLIITHDVDLARATADRILVMDKGRVVSECTADTWDSLGDLED